MTELKKEIVNALLCLPEPSAIRTRIAENLQERQLLRQLLKIAETKRTASTVRSAEGVDG